MISKLVNFSRNPSTLFAKGVKFFHDFDTLANIAEN